ncbi:hypothetical protein DM02DRAFT_312260 [Periconia macrospinosa]|uniref:Uncharacterized protein n=1 Tax=Periconia macrospinosa TaxID=97972 RepID=A0A2V1DXU3_9PLEO|nr:hypothetical protein DM02DRAFT_312260 [Periconia macrospinosa]
MISSLLSTTIFSTLSFRCPDCRHCSSNSAWLRFTSSIYTAIAQCTDAYIVREKHEQSARACFRRHSTYECRIRKTGGRVC